MRQNSREQTRKERPAKVDRGTRRPYHHGDLQKALIDATDAILAEQGVEGFTLREAARRAAVSHAAPQHHFGSAAGLLTEVAILGFAELTSRLQEANAVRGLDPRARLIQQGLAYVHFAIAYPGRFQVMFQRGKLLSLDVRLEAAGHAAFSELECVVQDYLGVGVAQRSDKKVAAMAVAVWSMAHGFAQLALDGKFDRMLASSNLESFVKVMFPAAFSAMSPRR